MTLAALSLQQAPPISVPFRFFIAAPLFLVLAACALLLSGSDAMISRWSPALLGITHLLTLGFMAMVMCGAMLQLLPVLAGAPVPKPRLMAWAIHLPLAGGSLLLSYALYFSATHLLTWAMVLLGAAFATFLAAAIRSLLHAPARNASTHAMLLALAALSLAAGLGLTLAAGLAGWADLPLLTLTTLHVGWALLGWTALLVIGIAYQVVPMFQLTPAYPRALTRWLGNTLFALLLIWAAHPLLPENFAAWLATAAELGIAACLALFAGVTLRLQFRRKRRVADITLQFWQVGMYSLLAAVALWLAGQAGTQLAASSWYALMLGVLFIAGFALSLIMGMLYKIVPFLIWFHLQSNMPGKRAPNVKKIIPDSATRWHWHTHLATLAALLLSAVWPAPWVYLAGVLLLLEGMLLFANLYGAWALYRKIASSA